jgi:hypothetical protein
LLQLLDAILASACDYLQVNTAFVISLTEPAPEIIAAVGPTRPNPKWLEEELETMNKLLQSGNTIDNPAVLKWHSYWITPLFSKRIADTSENDFIIGCLGVQARSTEVDLTPDERLVFRGQVRRAAATLDDMTLQTEIYAALEGLLPQISITRTRAAEVEFRPGREPAAASEGSSVDREQFTEQVRAALRHYWGGPGLTSSGLQGLRIVQSAMQENDGNPAKALRSILLKGIEKQKPEGERRLLSPEWTIYNILVERFIERHKVRDVAPRLALSEPDFYRKQKVAIEALADTLIEMETGTSKL